MSSDIYDELNEIIYAEAYEYLLAYQPRIAAWIERAVKAGKSPEEMRRYWLRKAGDHSTAIATRIENAAKYLVTEK